MQVFYTYDNHAFSVTGWNTNCTDSFLHYFSKKIRKNPLNPYNLCSIDIEKYYAAFNTPNAISESDCEFHSE
jgi:hypothetical protein